MDVFLGVHVPFFMYLVSKHSIAGIIMHLRNANGSYLQHRPETLGLTSLHFTQPQSADLSSLYYNIGYGILHCPGPPLVEAPGVLRSARTKDISLRELKVVSDVSLTSRAEPDRV